MQPTVQSVKALSRYRIELQFDNEEVRILDMNSYLDFGVFAGLKDEKLFQTVHVCFDSVEWDNGADLCPESLYENSMPLSGEMMVAEESEVYRRKDAEND